MESLCYLFLFLCLCDVRLAKTIVVDSHITAVSSDCYNRIAIGQRVTGSDVTRRINIQLVKECELECDKELDKCIAFNFGLGSEGNGTCELSSRLPSRSTLLEDPDYDVYLKKEECRYYRVPPPSYPNQPRPTTAPPPQKGWSSYSGCFRRVATGRRTNDQNIRRSVPLRSVDECQQECIHESRFVCEGFNFRYDESGRGRGSCELSDVPFSRLDLGFDFYPDRDYDFFEWDRDASPECRAGPPGNRQQSGNYGGSETHGTNWSGKGNSGEVGYYGSGKRWDSYGGSSYNIHSGSSNHGSVSGGQGVWDKNVRPWGTYGSGGSSYGGAWNYEESAQWRPGNNQNWNSGRPPYDGWRPEHPQGNWRPDYPQGAWRPENPQGAWRPESPQGAWRPESPQGAWRPESPQGAWRPESPQGAWRPESPQGAWRPEEPPSAWRPPPPSQSPWKPDPWRPDPPYNSGGGGVQRPPYGGSGGVWRPGPSPPSISGSDKYITFHGHGNDRNDGYYGHGHGNIYSPLEQECYIRSRTGFKFDRLIARVATTVSSLHECEAACAHEKKFVCLSFSFRYSHENNYPPENCFLSERPYNRLDQYNDLVPDRDFDIYTINEHSHGCVENFPSTKPNYGNTECFLRVRTGQRLEETIIKDSISVHSIGDCELQCLKAKYFTCRLFAYRYGPPVIGGPLDNCQLSDWPYLELDFRRHIVEDPSYELYERGSYGHGCEVDRYIPGPADRHPSHPEDTWTDEGGRHPISRPFPKPTDELCYATYGGPARLLPFSVKGKIQVRSEEECKAECSRAREQFKFYCLSLSFRNHAPPGQPNCFLSDIDQRDLRPGQDYVHEDDNWMFAWNSLDPHCDPRYFESGNNYFEHYEEQYIPGKSDARTWQKFTVSGRPCRRGSYCRQNREAGFWSCELEGGDAGSFDYCCRPGHQCGYSEGYDYPWCFVGSAARDQWRPCSDHFYPYPLGDHGHPSHTGGSQRQPPPPGYESYGPPRYWPVAYLHLEGPPNATIISPGDKHPGYVLGNHNKYQDHLDNNYIDYNRYGYGKNLARIPQSSRSNNSSGVQKWNFPAMENRNFETMKEMRMDDQNMTDTSKDKLLVFEVVDEDDDSASSGTGKRNEKTKSVLMLTDRLESPKVQPRLVESATENRKVSRIVERQPSTTWSWRSSIEGTTKKTPGPVEFRRKSISNTGFVTVVDPSPATIVKVNRPM